MKKKEATLTVEQDGYILSLSEEAFRTLIQLQEDGGNKAYLAMGLINEGLHAVTQEHVFRPEDEEFLRYVAATMTDLLRSFVDFDGHANLFYNLNTEEL